MARLLRILASKRAALALLGTAAAACLAGAAWPGIFASAPFAALAAALAVNTAACTLKMTLEEVDRRERTSPPPPAAPGVVTAEWACARPAAAATGAAAHVLRRHGYRVTLSTPGPNGPDLFARRGAAGRWALIGFHIALVAILALIGLQVLTHTERRILATEWQFREDRPGEYLSLRQGPLSPPFRNFFWTPRAVREDSFDLLVTGLRFDRRVILTSSPDRRATFEGFEFHLERAGPAPLVSVWTDGAERFAAFLAIDGRDEVRIPGTDLTLDLEWDDAAGRLHGTLQRQGAVLLDARLAEEERRAEGPFELAFGGLRHWGIFTISRDPFLVPLFAAIGTALGFLAAHVAIFRRRVWMWAAPEGSACRLRACGRADRFPHLFEEEFAGAMEEIRTSHDAE